jgi:ribosomal protein S18 acetylase RimI-like enzyme
VPPTPLTIRPRTAADLPRLVEVLAAQQPATGYPVRWPLPFPVEQFIVRTSEVAAWVAADDSGRPLGHVAVLDVAPGWDADGWTAGTGMPAGSLAAVGVLFVDPTATGRGVGTALLSTAVEHVFALGRVPVLDVVSESTRAVALYRRHGWRVVGTARPPWLPADRDPLLLMALAEPAPPLGLAEPAALT